VTWSLPVLIIAAAPALVLGQAPAAAMTDAQALALYERAVQLMESSPVAIPELARSGAPLTENAKQAVLTLKTINLQNAPAHYRFLVNLRAFLLLSDAIPKPNPFPAEAQQQITELRDALNRTEAYFESFLDRMNRQLRDPDRDNLKRYEDADARLGQPAPAKPRVVFMGDSITDFWRLNEYFPDRDFVNRGISGQITGQMLGRFKQDVINLHPAAVVIHAGTNDIARGVSLAAIESNLATMSELAMANKIKPILTTVLPISDYHKNEDPFYERSKQRKPEVIRSLNLWISEYCRSHAFPVVNYYVALVDGNGFLRADLARDGLHPDPQGYRLMAPLVLETIDKTLAPAPAPPPQGKKRRLF
jgi:lysophospholipase L1-like esterase